MTRRIWIGPVLLLVTCVAFAQAPSSDAVAKPQTKEELLAYFDRTSDNLLGKVNGLSEAQWKFKPAPDRWSVAEVFEHITVTEQALQGMMKQALQAEANAAKKPTAQDAGIVPMTTDRSRKFKAPESVQPTGRFATQQQALEAFKKARAATVDMARSTPEEVLRAHTASSPGGEMDIHQFLLFTAAHSERHTKQIEEVMADAKFPKK